MTYLVTGGAGFIGSHVVDALLARGEQVVAFDNFNDYYAPDRKRRHLIDAQTNANFTLVEGDIRDGESLARLFATYNPTHVAHLAAMAGPRYSVQHPLLYEEVNVRGTMHVLDLARRYAVKGMIIASTSSVYGALPTPWEESQTADRPLSPYAATKRAAELLAYTYHYQYGVPTRVLRFFTVYGPRGRPDMTPSLFVDKMRHGAPITLFNAGLGVYRDWTYISDIVAGVLAALNCDLPFDVFNLGNSNPVELIEFVRVLEQITGLTALIESQPLPAADPARTFACIDRAQALLGFQPQTPLARGLALFWEWYRREYGC
ncbi:MAG: NAD-dependent epimerase/dehydratase family protein [Chloroflexia bacterium]|nr:NAD-dependent epimerase/dehydratase family protein [Chloroflexia bacterium]